MLETAARFYYSSQAELLTFNFYPIVILAIITVVGKKSHCMAYNFYCKPYNCMGLGFGSHSRNAFVPQLQDYQYGDLGYNRMVGLVKVIYI